MAEPTRELQDATSHLQQEIGESKRILATARIEGTHYFLDQALGRYLWGSIATAETILAAVGARKAGGAEALKRQLHEALIDVYYVLSSPDPDLCAAQSALKDLLDWRDLWKLHTTVTRKFPEFPFPPIPKEWQATLSQEEAQIAKALDRVSAELGGPTDMFTQAKHELDRTRFWHWSGMSRVGMIRELEKRGQLDTGGAAIATTLTKLHNVGSHASPSWSVLAVEIKGERNEHVFPDPSSSDEDDLIQLAAHASHFLKAIREAVATRIHTGEKRH